LIFQIQALSASTMTPPVIKPETPALTTTITTTLAVVTGIPKISFLGTNVASVEVVSELLSQNLLASMMTPLVILMVILAQVSMTTLQAHVEAMILKISLLLTNAAPVMEEPTTPQESLRMQLPIFVSMTTLLLTLSMILAQAGMTTIHLDVEATMMMTSLPQTLVASVVEDHLMVSQPTQLHQLQLDVSTMTLLEILSVILALPGTMTTHLDVETTILQTSLLPLSAALVEEVFTMVLSKLLLMLDMVLSVPPTSQHQTTLEIPAPGTICTVDNTVKALGMMMTSQLLPNAALVEEVFIDLFVKSKTIA